MKRINIHLTDLQIKELKKLSDNTGISVSELVRRAIDEYLRKQKERSEL